MKTVHPLLSVSSYEIVTFATLAVVQSMWVDAVRSGCSVPQVDDHCVSFLSHQQRPKVAHPIWFTHFCPIGGVAVLLVYSLLVGGANTLGVSLQEGGGFSTENKMCVKCP